MQATQLRTHELYPGRRWRMLVPVGALLSVAACIGTIRNPTPEEGDGTPGVGGPKAPPPPVTTPGVAAVDCKDFRTGPVFHRLNRTELQNSVNALLGTRLALRDDLPDDDLVDGFDNSADVTVSATLMQKYLDAASKAV